MQELELKELWQTSNERLEKSLKISQQQAEDIKQLKVQHYLSSMKPIKAFTIIVGLIWVGIGVPLLSMIFLNAYEQANKFFLFSATIQVLITAIALAVYIYQLITIYNVNVTETVLKTQKELATLKSSTLWITRILFLQLPVWTTFWWNKTMLTDWGVLQWIVTLFFTLLFTVIAIWLFLNIKYEKEIRNGFNSFLVEKNGHH